ncbi:aquaporin NIP1-1-like [Euphorbia lathyris]|uniref:aquaporin NIP1-1-like n=1 Tax=Euphorbia lathyris TaxID=212925 RepID=UPI0033137729
MSSPSISVTSELSPKHQLANKRTLGKEHKEMSSPISISVTSELSPKMQLAFKQQLVATEPKATKVFVEDDAYADADASPSIFQKVLAEFVGTYFLVFVGCGAALTDRILQLSFLGIAIVWGVILMALIYAVGHISGAHFNPAVSIAFAAAQKFPWKHVPAYILVQILGATVASLTLKAMYSKEDDIEIIVTSYKDSTSHLEAIIWEFIATFLLMFVISGVATDDRASKNIAGVAIGGTLMIDAMLIGPITGASLNPARSLGPAIVSGVYKNLWVYIVSPIFGALAASLVYKMLRVSEPEKPQEKSKSVFNHLYTPGEP